jgi:protein O-GlcNAc transferase
MRPIDQAIAAHRNGNLTEAETLYRRVLAANARDFDALHMPGIVFAQRGQFVEAEKFLRAA